MYVNTCVCTYCPNWYKYHQPQLLLTTQVIKDYLLALLMHGQMIRQHVHNTYISMLKWG